MNINIYELNKKKDLRNKTRLKTFNYILNKCGKRIKIASNNLYTSCVFKIPSYIYGKPLFKVKDCADFILNKLRDKGFKLIYFEPNIIYIDWKEIPVNNKIKKEDFNQHLNLLSNNKKKLII